MSLRKGIRRMGRLNRHITEEPQTAIKLSRRLHTSLGIRQEDTNISCTYEKAHAVKTKSHIKPTETQFNVTFCRILSFCSGVQNAGCVYQVSEMHAQGAQVQGAYMQDAHMHLTFASAQHINAA